MQKCDGDDTAFRRSVSDHRMQHDCWADVGKRYVSLASIVGWKKSLKNAV